MLYLYSCNPNPFDSYWSKLPSDSKDYFALCLLLFLFDLKCSLLIFMFFNADYTLCTDSFIVLISSAIFDLFLELRVFCLDDLSVLTVVICLPTFRRFSVRPLTAALGEVVDECLNIYLFISLAIIYSSSAKLSASTRSYVFWTLNLSF